MGLLENIKNLWSAFMSARLKARRYPIYRVFERALRVGVAAFVLTILEKIFLGTLSWELIVAGGFAAMMDKVRNEYNSAMRNYDLSSWEGLLSLFEADDG